MKFDIKKATLQDAKIIHSLINAAAREGEMLPRALGEIYEDIRDFFIAIDENNEIIGCCALQITWENLAEIRSLVVKKEYALKGIGKTLINYCINEAKSLKIKRVFALTYATDFFIKNGFNLISKDELPHKVWTVCIKCHKFPDCDEQAVAIDLF